MLPGGTAASNPPAGAEEANTPPHELVTAVRAASNAGASVDPNKMYDFDGKSYAAESILAVIGAEDAEAGVDSTTSGRRKSKHCVPRATELMVDGRWRDRLARSRTPLSKAELDNKETGEKRDVHLDLWESFKDENVKVRPEDFIPFRQCNQLFLFLPQSNAVSSSCLCPLLVIMDRQERLF